MMDNDWSIISTAPSNIKFGAIDLTSNAEFPTDIDGLPIDYSGNLRTNDNSGGATNPNAGGWTIGAFEQDNL
jgi:hypothetical protein